MLEIQLILFRVVTRDQSENQLIPMSKNSERKITKNYFMSGVFRLYFMFEIVSFSFRDHNVGLSSVAAL